jgi:hypothetical protein
MSYRDNQQDATVQDNLLLHCSLIAQHVSSDIVAHHQELPNSNYSFWFYSRLSLPAAAMPEWKRNSHSAATTNVSKTRSCN